MGGANLHIVAEDIIEGDLERRDAGTLALPSLELKEVVLAVGGELTQFVELGADAWGDGCTTAKG